MDINEDIISLMAKQVMFNGEKLDNVIALLEQGKRDIDKLINEFKRNESKRKSIASPYGHGVQD